MRLHAIRFMVALLMFAIGVSAYAVSAFLYRPLDTEGQVIPASQLREDELHRLYEAALMIGKQDWDSKRLVFNTLMCTNADGVVDARLRTEGENKVGCERPDGTFYELNFAIGPYGIAFDRIRREHSSWSLKNLQFVKEVGTQERATKYVHEHMLSITP